jgi:3,4-dihydroxy 2-butanone 4-phosphate synthase/GTP cyclohydrolase II
VTGDVLDALRGHGVVMLYDPQRDEGDIVAAARSVTDDAVTTMVAKAGGLVAVVVLPGQAARLGLRTMPTNGGVRTHVDRLPAIVSVEARHGISTGISSADRARTIRAVASSKSGIELVSPGHVFPFVAASGGLLARRGRLEAGVDLSRLGGTGEGAAICDVLGADGGLAREDEIRALADENGIPITTIPALTEARFDHQWDAWSVPTCHSGDR